MIKKSAFGLIGKLGEFSLARKQIVSSDEFENVLKILCEMIFSDDESQQLAAINTANGVYSHTPPSLSEITSLLNSGALCSFATILRGEHQLDDGKSLTFRENVRIEAIKLLKSLMQRNDEIEEEENEEASVKDQVARSKIIRDCGVVKFALEFLGNRVNSKEAIKASTSSTPSKVVIYLTELVAESMKPISHQTEHIEKLLENRAEEVFVRQTLLCTVAIDSMLEDTLRKRVTDPNADVDRKLILIQAQLRKASLFVLSQFATSEERCLQLVSLEPTDKDLFDGRDKIIPLCGHIVASMGKFDLEATNIACNLLRNMFISDNSREIALKQLKLGQFGSALIDLCSNRNQNTASIAAGITRFVCSSHSLEDLQNAFPESTMAKALNLDLTKIYPTVRVELARALSHAMQTVAKFSKESEPLAKLLLTTEAVSLVAFLLQSKHGILVTEALDALRVLPPALLKVAGKEVKIYLPMDELTDDEEPELTEKDMEALEEALKKLDTLEITEEDVDLSKLDPNRTKGTVIEEEKKRKQAQEQEKRKDNDGEKVEDDVVTITLESRISSFSKQKINLEGQEDDPEAVAKIASSVLEVMKS
uniref:Uncharacterized protein n=1 Tax=Aplanochytrium stocchinoi TaxID=215587 RepID=A0A7S3LJB6_9STRA